jgi:competence protein ComEC
MKGKLIFCTLSSLFGIISVFEGIWAVGLFLLYLYCLWGIKKIPSKQIFPLLTIYILYLIVSYFSLINNKTTLPPIKTQFLIQFSDESKVDGNQFRAVVLDTEMEEKLILSYKIPSHFKKKFLQQNQMIKKVCMVTGKLEQPSTSRNQNAFNYKEYLKQKRIFWELKVTNWEFGSCKNGKLNLLDKIRLLR